MFHGLCIQLRPQSKHIHKKDGIMLTKTGNYVAMSDILAEN